MEDVGQAAVRISNRLAESNAMLNKDLGPALEVR